MSSFILASLFGSLGLCAGGVLMLCAVLLFAFVVVVVVVDVLPVLSGSSSSCCSHLEGTVALTEPFPELLAGAPSWSADVKAEPAPLPAPALPTLTCDVCVFCVLVLCCCIVLCCLLL